MTDEPYPEGFEEQYEIVDVSEAGIEVEKPTHDEFGAPIAKVVKVRDGVGDTESRKGKRP